MTSAIADGIAMVMGIDIDFGMQIVTRFRQELRENDVENALTMTLSNVIKPMTITTIVILIGFRAMSSGKLTFRQPWRYAWYRCFRLLFCRYYSCSGSISSWGEIFSS